MFRTEKPRQNLKTKPEIWAAGRQFAPFDTGAWARASTILARRAAARMLGHGSMTCAQLAFGLEEGRWRVDVSRLGRAAMVMPSRMSVARSLARVSRVQAMAGDIVNHHGEAIAPLEIADLNAFMRSRRAAAQAETAAKRAAKPVRPVKRAVRPAAKPVDPALATMFGGPVAEPTPAPVLQDPTNQTPLATLSITPDELNAIRLALASAPEPQEAIPDSRALPAPPPPRPQPRSVFASGSAHWYEDRPPVTPAPAPKVNRQNPLVRVLKALSAVVLGTTKRAISAIWRPVKGALAQTFATALGWSLVVLALPYGAVRAIILHLHRVDLRYFD